MAGYDPEVAVQLANDLGVKLEVVEITGPNRVPFLLSNRIDMVISTFSITPERAKVIDFSVPYASAMVMLAAPASTDIKNAADLKGHKVGVTRGTTGDMELTKQAPNATIVRFDDEATTVTAVSSGQIEIVAGEPVMLLGVAKRNPGKNIEQKFVLADFSVGIGLRKNEPELKTWVNNWVRDNLRNGMLNGLFKKFHGVDLPPTVVNASH
jgi:polar amino acid transport system substrate-binding protein